MLDADYIPELDLFQNLHELDFINHWLGGYEISFSALKQILKKDFEYTLVDIGSGGGDTLKRIASWARQQGFKLRLHGIDIKPVCINYARNNDRQDNIEFICDDYRNIFQHVPTVNIIHASLFCHHLTNEELIELVKFSIKNKTILIINDLERNGLAYYLIKGLTGIFSKSYLVKHDAPVSVSRGFKKKEWLDIVTQAGAVRYSIKNRWAFRHEVIVYPA